MTAVGTEPIAADWTQKASNLTRKRGRLNLADSGDPDGRWDPSCMASKDGFDVMQWERLCPQQKSEPVWNRKVSWAQGMPVLLVFMPMP